MSNPVEIKANSYLDRLIDFSAPIPPKTSLVFKSVENEVRLICRIWLTLPGNGNSLAANDPATALKDLLGFGTIKDLPEMVNAVDAVNNAISTYLTDERRKFLELVGDDTVTVPEIMKIVDTRRNDEVKEQNGLLSKANDLKQKVTDLATKLNVPLVPIATVANTNTAPPVQKLTFFQRLIMVPDTKAETPKAAFSNCVSWKTPPILDSTCEPDISRMDRIWTFVFVNKSDPAVVLNTLVNTYGLNEEKLKDLFGRLYDKVLKQISQSQEILTEIEKDYKLYQGCINVALELFGLLVEVGNFFGFEVVESKSQATKTK